MSYSLVCFGKSIPNINVDLFFIFFICSTHSMAIWMIELNMIHSLLPSLTTKRDIWTHLVFKKCLNVFLLVIMHLCTHFTSPYHAIHAYMWKQTHRADVQHVAVSGVESWTCLTNSSLCSHQITTQQTQACCTPLSDLSAHHPTVETDCNLYQSGAALN